MLAKDISRIGYQQDNLIPKEIKGYQLTNILNLYLSNMACKLGIYEKQCVPFKYISLQYW